MRSISVVFVCGALLACSGRSASPWIVPDPVGYPDHAADPPTLIVSPSDISILPGETVPVHIVLQGDLTGWGGVNVEVGDWFVIVDPPFINGSEGTVSLRLKEGASSCHAYDGALSVSATAVKASASPPFHVWVRPDPGTPTGFDESGVDASPFEPCEKLTSAIAPAADGGVFEGGAIGSVVDWWQESPIVSRMSSTGFADAGFGVRGVVRLPFERGAVLSMRSVPGGVLAAGIAAEGCFVARLDDSGALVPDFGDSGVVTFGDDCLGASIDENGRAFLDARTEIAAFDADGTPDMEWGDAGVAVSPAPADGGDATQLFATSSGVSLIDISPDGARVSRFRPDGSLDPDFGDHGRAIWPAPLHDAYLLRAASDPAGRLFVLVHAYEANTENDPPLPREDFLVRFSTDGSVDWSVPAHDLQSLAVGPDGVLAIGYDYFGSVDDLGSIEVRHPLAVAGFGGAAMVTGSELYLTGRSWSEFPVTSVLRTPWR